MQALCLPPFYWRGRWQAKCPTELLNCALSWSRTTSTCAYSDGTEALAHLHETKPDFILTDLSMAPMDGLEFTRAVRHSADESLCVLPIIVVTGHTERVQIKAARDAGVTEILAKPVTATGLYQRIDEIIQRPRPFVRTPDYCGPCRRRQHNPAYTGPWRRSSDGNRAETAAVVPVAKPAATKRTRT